MDFSHIANGGLALSKADCDRIAAILCEVNSLLAAIHDQGYLVIENSGNPERMGNSAVAIQSMAMVGCRKVDAVARALGDPGFGSFEDELSPDYAEGGR